ncbi:hypothetical protein D3C76_1833780 [compost metagenome]
MTISDCTVDVKGYKANLILTKIYTHFSTNQLNGIFGKFILDRINLFRFAQKRIMKGDILLGPLNGKGKMVC